MQPNDEREATRYYRYGFPGRWRFRLRAFTAVSQVDPARLSDAGRRRLIMRSLPKPTIRYSSSMMQCAWKNMPGGETFFFAHDPQLLGWLNGQIKSTAVLPIDGKLFRDLPDLKFDHAGNVVFYHWREEKKEELLLMARDQIAELKQLYTHTGTIHSVLHFIWFCGFKKVTLHRLRRHHHRQRLRIPGWRIFPVRSPVPPTRRSSGRSGC